jgi:hypothetical protein
MNPTQNVLHQRNKHYTPVFWPIRAEDSIFAPKILFVRFFFLCQRFGRYSAGFPE